MPVDAEFDTSPLIDGDRELLGLPLADIAEVVLTEARLLDVSEEEAENDGCIVADSELKPDSDGLIET